MRITTAAILVGTALLGAASPAGVAPAAAADAAGTAARHATRRDGLFCGERCDAAYRTCMRWRTGKGTRDCPGDLMRCRRECDPTGTSGIGAASRAAAAQRLGLSCPDACQADYDACIRRDDGKHGQACAKSVMVCRRGCPKAPSRPLAVTEPSMGAPVVPNAKVPSTAAAEAHEIPAPAAAERHPAPESVHQAEPAPARAAGARGPGLWARAWCAISGCGASGARAPLTCPEACSRDYDACVAREDPKRGGDCATAAVRCKQRCGEAPSAGPRDD